MRGIALSEHNEKVADIVKNISEFMRYNSTARTAARRFRWSFST